MEKKGNRSHQPASKGIGSDSKKNQDAVNKPGPRGSRRRESNGGAFPKTGDSSRKPIPQRNKNLDKRPRPRGFYYTGAVGGNEEPGLEPTGETSELGSVFLQGSKKQSLNHLLNFHFEPRENLGHTVSSTPRGAPRWNATIKHKYNKEQFLQATCQFIVKESGDYREYMNNPDALVDWNLIEQVNLQVSEHPSCPICLYPPTAAKITRCGHIYCWSCLLHYLALSDTTCRKCPMCFEDVQKNDLRSVFTESHATFNTSDEITFKLMKRYKDSLITYPADYEYHSDELLNVSDNNTAHIHSKLLLAGKSEVAYIIKRERVQLLTQLSEDENCPERCFIEQALALLHEREMGVSNVTCESVQYNKSRNLVAPTTKIHYFYQASDGQHIYLHALNVRMLEHTYGCLEYSPKTITGRIIEKECGSMTEDIRNRMRCLQHLPITCKFEVAEILLTPPLVSNETMAYFHEQIEMRQRRRQRKVRDEKRHEKKIIEAENRKMGKYPIPDIKLQSDVHFPEFQADVVDVPVTASTPTPSSSLASSLNTENEYPGMSFAKMLSGNKSKSPIWPTRKNVSNTLPQIPNNNQIRRTTEAIDVDDYVAVPEFNQSFGDAIAVALEKVSLHTGGDQPTSSSKKKKKNKGRQIVFATSMAYSNK